MFTPDLLSTRLREAQSGTRFDQSSLTWHQRYARLATPHAIDDASEFLRTLHRWPTEFYGDAPVKQQQEVLDWLLANVGKVSGFDRRNAFQEQWHLARLTLVEPERKELEGLARFTERRDLTPPSRLLFAALKERQTDHSATLSWLRHLIHNEAWEEAVEDGEKALTQMVVQGDRAEVYRILAEALLSRGRAPESGPADADRAFHLLFHADSEGAWGHEHQRLLDKAVEKATPDVLKLGRAQAPHLLGEAMRGMKRIGMSIGSLFGGRSDRIPHSQAVLDAAPSLLRPGEVAEWLGETDALKDEFAAVTDRRDEDAEASVVAGSFALDGAWTLAQIDPSVLDAITFASAGNPEGFWHQQEIAQGVADSEGATSRLMGYVAEQQVAIDLTNAGHDVAFPESASQPGFDLLVDGAPVQVKCAMDSASVMEHLETYPDVPVVVNRELAESLGDHPMVFVDENLSHAEVLETTIESVEALSGFAELDNLVHLPFIAIGFAAYRNYASFHTGRIDTEQYASRVGVDAATRTAGGAVGYLLGGAVGAVLGPVGSILGAGIAGYIGSVAGGTGGNAINRGAVCDARDEVVAELEDFARWFHAEPLPARIDRLTARREQMKSWVRKNSTQLPRVSAAFYASSYEMVNRAVELHGWLEQRLEGDEFAKAHAGWVALRESSTVLHPDLKPRFARIEGALSRYKAAQEA